MQYAVLLSHFILAVHASQQAFQDIPNVSWVKEGQRALDKFTATCDNRSKQFRICRHELKFQPHPLFVGWQTEPWLNTEAQICSWSAETNSVQKSTTFSLSVQLVLNGHGRRLNQVHVKPGSKGSEDRNTNGRSVWNSEVVLTAISNYIKVEVNKGQLWQN